MNKLDYENIDQDEEFNNLQVNKIKTEKLEYSYNNNIIYIDSNNCNYLNLNENDSNSILITDEPSLNINITLSSNKVGTKYQIVLSNIQNSLKILSSNQHDIFIGAYSLNHNSNINELSSKDNKSKKKIINKSDIDGNTMFYIPHYNYGLYNGGVIYLTYLGTNYNNLPELFNNQLDQNLYKSYWFISGSLIGDIKIPLTINIIKTLKIYLSTTKKNIYYVTSSNSTDNYFNKIYNNNIILFYGVNYSNIQIIDINTNNILYDNSNTTTTYEYNIYVKNFTGNYINIPSGLNLDQIMAAFSNIESLYDIFSNTPKNIINNNCLEYKITKTVNNNETIIIESFLNIVDSNAYFNQVNNINNHLNFENIIFNFYNGFTILENNLINII